MPMYLGQAVSDAYLQALIKAYRDGQDQTSGLHEESDQAVITRLESQQVVVAHTAPSAFDLGVQDGA